MFNSCVSNTWTNPAGYVISPKWLNFIEGRQIPDWKRFPAVAANKQALIKFLGESIVQHYRLSSLEMSSGEVLYLSGASNHYQENQQKWSPRLSKVILYTWRGGHSYDFTCYPCRQNVRWKWNQRSDHC